MKIIYFKYPLIALILVYGYLFASEFINKDECLNSGGNWNSPLKICETEHVAKVNLVMIDKSKAKMVLFSDDSLVREYNVVFGANPKGHKQQEGDEKTPEGTYTLDYKKDDSSFYRSMHKETTLVGYHQLCRILIGRMVV